MKQTMERHGNKIQWVAILTAAMAGLQQLLDAGILSEEHAVWILMATNVISAALPQLRRPGKKPVVTNRG